MLMSLTCCVNVAPPFVGMFLVLTDVDDIGDDYGTYMHIEGIAGTSLGSSYFQEISRLAFPGSFFFLIFTSFFFYIINSAQLFFCKYLLLHRMLVQFLSCTI